MKDNFFLSALFPFLVGVWLILILDAASLVITSSSSS